MREKTIAGFLKEYAGKDTVSFHMPGHKGRSELFAAAGYGGLVKDAAAWDITEVPGRTLCSVRAAFCVMSWTITQNCMARAIPSFL